MKPCQIQLVRESFALIELQAVQAGALFYDKLFECDPSISMLFHTDMGTQSRRLFEMVGDAVRLQNSPEQLDAVLGAHHVAYGVRDEHYDTVSGTLLDTLDAALGDEFMPELCEAWLEFYDRISRVMREGALNRGLVGGGARPFRAIDGLFARDAVRGYYGGSMVSGSEGASFQALSEHEVRDRQAIYYCDSRRSCTRSMRATRAGACISSASTCRMPRPRCRRRSPASTRRWPRRSATAEALAELAAAAHPLHGRQPVHPLSPGLGVDILFFTARATPAT